MAIDLKRGFFRAWLVVSVVWAILILALVVLIGQPGWWAKPDVWASIAAFIFVPSVVFLVLGLLVRWIISGFRSEE